MNFAPAYQPMPGAFDTPCLPEPSPRIMPRSCLRHPVQSEDENPEEESCRSTDILLLRYLFCDYVIPAIHVLIPAWLLHRLVSWLLAHYYVHQQKNQSFGLKRGIDRVLEKHGITPIHSNTPSDHETGRSLRNGSELDPYLTKRQLRLLLQQSISRETALKQSLRQVRADLGGSKEARRLAEECWMKKRTELENRIEQLELEVENLKDEMDRRNKEEEELNSYKVGESLNWRAEDDLDALADAASSASNTVNDNEEEEDEEDDDWSSEATQSEDEEFNSYAVSFSSDEDDDQPMLEKIFHEAENFSRSSYYRRLYCAAFSRIQDAHTNSATVASVLLSLDDLFQKFSEKPGLDPERALIAAVARSWALDTDGKRNFADRWQRLFHKYLPLEEHNMDEEEESSSELSSRMDLILWELEKACRYAERKAHPHPHPHPEDEQKGAQKFPPLVVCLYRGKVIDTSAVERWFSREPTAITTTTATTTTTTTAADTGITVASGTDTASIVEMTKDDYRKLFAPYMRWLKEMEAESDNESDEEEEEEEEEEEGEESDQSGSISDESESTDETESEEEEVGNTPIKEACIFSTNGNGATNASKPLARVRFVEPVNGTAAI